MAKTTKGRTGQRMKQPSRDELPKFVRAAIAKFKNQIKTGRGLDPYERRERGLPALSKGHFLYKFDAGQDRQGGRGKCRLVALVMGGNYKLREVYYLDPEAEGSKRWESTTDARQVPAVLRSALKSLATKIRAKQGLHEWEKRSGLPKLKPRHLYVADASESSPSLIAVVEVGKPVFQSMYYTDSHYLKGEWMLLPK